MERWPEEPEWDEKDEEATKQVWSDIHERFIATLVNPIKEAGWHFAEMRLEDARYWIVRGWKDGENKAWEACSCARHHAIIALADKLGVTIQKDGKTLVPQADMACVHDIDPTQSWWHATDGPRYNRLDFQQATQHHA
ncbi:MAG: hypothetical protein JSS66_07660 [Armatimonadetes bacterium]|nr:hypothetical protein [Armatimonadota bacterium]